MDTPSWYLLAASSSSVLLGGLLYGGLHRCLKVPDVSAHRPHRAHHRFHGLRQALLVRVPLIQPRLRGSLRVFPKELLRSRHALGLLQHEVGKAVLLMAGTAAAQYKPDEMPD